MAVRGARSTLSSRPIRGTWCVLCVLALGALGACAKDGGGGQAGSAGSAAGAGAAGTSGGAAGTSGGAGTTATGSAGAGTTGLPDAGVDRSEGPRDVGAPEAPSTGKADASIETGTRLPTLTVEALQVAGTHNSYHQAPAVAFDASHKYTHKPLDQQLDGGVRALELDLHRASDGTFEIYHIAVIDPTASCRTLEDCLRVVSTWSTAHPRHAPIFIWFELKDDTGGSPIDDLVPVEAAILKVLAKERLLTPAWLRGTHASPHARLLAAGWPSLDEARGKIMFAIITRDDRTRAYAHGGTSLDDRLMWVNPTPAEFAQPWAAITKVEDQGLQAVIAQAHAAHLLIAANTCAVNMTDDACAARLREFADAGVHMLHDDLPFSLAGRGYSLKLPGGASPACNPVTAPLTCAAPLE